MAPAGLINKIRLSAEKDITKKSSVGAIISQYYGNWQGQRLDLNYRYYFAKKKEDYGHDGFYSIFQVGVAIFNTPYTLTKSTTNSLSITSPEFVRGEKSFAYGVGIGIGYRKTINRFFLDANFRIQNWSLQSKPDIVENIPGGTKTYEAFREDGLNFRTIGPGGIFSPTLIFGYIF